MSGGSHDYAYSKINMISELFGDIYKRSMEDCGGEKPSRDAAMRKHPLRVALAKFMAEELSPVLRSIEWSDSGDSAPDGWIDDALRFFEKHGIAHDPEAIDNWVSEAQSFLEGHGKPHTVSRGSIADW